MNIILQSQGALVARLCRVLLSSTSATRVAQLCHVTGCPSARSTMSASARGMAIVAKPSPSSTLRRLSVRTGFPFSRRESVSAETPQLWAVSSRRNPQRVRWLRTILPSACKSLVSGLRANRGSSCAMAVEISCSCGVRLITQQQPTCRHYP